MKKLNKNQKLAIIVAICWCFVSCTNDTDQAPQTDTPAVEEDAQKLTPREKVRLKIPLTQEEKRQLVKDMSGDLSKLNTKPTEDKGY
ncbi:MAG: hypothetical protein K2J64_07485 [Desulfovibrio sp.]|nr:hypothetical protein [Desulfovibrio sp.]